MDLPETERAWIEDKLRNSRGIRSRGIGVWVSRDNWNGRTVIIEVRSYKKGRSGLVQFIVPYVDFYGEVNAKKTYRLAKGKIIKWNKELCKNTS